MLKMLIADDHPIVRQRLIELLTEGFPTASFSEAEDTSMLLLMADNHEWDIIVSDLAMPGGGGMLALDAIRKKQPALPFIIISTYPEIPYGERVVKAGATAFVNKDVADRDLVPAIRKALPDSC